MLRRITKIFVIFQENRNGTLKFEFFNVLFSKFNGIFETATSWFLNKQTNKNFWKFFPSFKCTLSSKLTCRHVSYSKYPPQKPANLKNKQIFLSLLSFSVASVFFFTVFHSLCASSAPFFLSLSLFFISINFFFFKVFR